MAKIESLLDKSLSQTKKKMNTDTKNKLSKNLISADFYILAYVDYLHDLKSVGLIEGLDINDFLDEFFYIYKDTININNLKLIDLDA